MSKKKKTQQKEFLCCARNTNKQTLTVASTHLQEIYIKLWDSEGVLLLVRLTAPADGEPLAPDLQLLNNSHLQHKHGIVEYMASSQVSRTRHTVELQINTCKTVHPDGAPVSMRPHIHV